MRMIVMLLFMGLCLGGNAAALNVKGVTVEPSVKVGDELLDLNGYGMRKKYFFNIYLGSFYSAEKVSTPEEVLTVGGGKLIRMNFLYSRVKRLNVLGAFAEGIYRNIRPLSGSAEEKAFLGWFKSDFLEGDLVDLAIAGDGTVAAYQNYKLLGTLHSPELAKAILLIYFGDVPADEGMKKGMLGQS